MQLDIGDDATAEMVDRLAKLRGLPPQEAVKLAVQAELDRAMPLRNRFAALRAAMPMPDPTGDVADKSFFDELSGTP